MKRLLSILLLALGALAALSPQPAQAHALEPGFLELTPLAGQEWRATWRRPEVQGRPMAIEALLPEGCVPRRGPPPVSDGRAFVSGWIARCPNGIAGGEIRIEGLEATRTDVLVRYLLEPGGAVQSHRLTPDAPAFSPPPPRGPAALLLDYGRLGFEHILEGFDHLLFVAALLLLVRRLRPLAAAITAFTLGHSLSLAAATLGWLIVPAPPVEASIALSIAVLAAELARPPGRGLRLTARHPWAVAAAFGLLHGLGFAGALREIGLPQGDVPLALLGFNLGVELGQLAFIAAVLTALRLLTRLVPLPAATPRLAAYATGTLAAYWTIERLGAMLA